MGSTAEQEVAARLRGVRGLNMRPPEALQEDAQRYQEVHHSLAVQRAALIGADILYIHLYIYIHQASTAIKSSRARQQNMDNAIKRIQGRDELTPIHPSASVTDSRRVSRYLPLFCAMRVCAHS